MLNFGKSEIEKISEVNKGQKNCNISNETFILHNMKNVDIVSEKVVSDFGQYKKCPRCKYILEHVEKLLLKVATINKLDVIGICDNCYTKDRKGISCCKCNRIVKNFIAIKNQDNKIKEEDKQRSERQQLLNLYRTNKFHDRTKSESFLGNLCHIGSKQTREPQVGHLFDPKKEFCLLNQKQKQHGRLRFSRTAETFPITSKSNSDTKRENSDDTLKIMVRKNDVEYPLRRTSSSQESLNVHKVVDEIEHTQKAHYNGKDDEEFLKFDYEKESPVRRYVSLKKDYIKEKTLPFNSKIEDGTPTKSISVESTGVLKATKQMLPLTIPLKKYHSEENLLVTDLTTTRESLYKDFSFVFIKETEIIKKPTPNYESSSELIKMTQEMLRVREEELNQKLVKEENKRVAREENMKLLDERKRILRERRHKTLDINKKVLREERERNVTDKVDTNRTKLNILRKVSKDTRTSSEKVETKIDKPDKSKKVQKQKDKEERLKFEKERKLEEKDRLEKEKKEQLRRAKVEKEKLNREKEKQIKKEKETLKKVKETERRQKMPETEHRKLEVDDVLTSQRGEPHDKVKTENKSKLKTPDTKISAASVKVKTEKKVESPKSNEFNVNQIKVRKLSPDDLILQLVKLKQSEPINPRQQPKHLPQINTLLTVIAKHMDHKSQKLSTCVICNDSELEFDIENIIFNQSRSTAVTDIIIGQQVCKYKPLIQKAEEKQTVPILFTATFNDNHIVPEKCIVESVPEQLDRKPPLLIDKYTEQEAPKGVIRYALSDRTFIDKGWTMLPTEKVVRKMNVYRMLPAHPEFDWFQHNKNKKIMNYDSGEKFAEFDERGRVRWYYRSGRIALDYYDAQEINAQKRFVIHSSGEPDKLGFSRPLVILASFDYLGNGIIFDHSGKIRLKYNQTEGVVLDRSIGPVSHWKWHSLNDPPVLQQIMIDTEMAHKDCDILKLSGTADNKTRPDNEEMLAIEFDNFIKEKSKKLSQKFKPFQIKMKAMKINEHFSLKVLDQATIYLIFRDGSINLKLNIGMILDHKEIVDTDTAEVGEVSNSLERFPAKTNSLAGLQQSVAYAQRVERVRVQLERRLRPTQPCFSSEKLIAAISRPLRAPPCTAPSSTTFVTGDCQKPLFNNLYCDIRLV